MRLRTVRKSCEFLGVTFDDGEVARLEREDVHRIFQSGSPHLIRISRLRTVNVSFLPWTFLVRPSSWLFNACSRNDHIMHDQLGPTALTKKKQKNKNKKQNPSPTTRGIFIISKEGKKCYFCLFLVHTIEIIFWFCLANSWLIEIWL